MSRALSGRNAGSAYRWLLGVLAAIALAALADNPGSGGGGDEPCETTEALAEDTCPPPDGDCGEGDGDGSGEEPGQCNESGCFKKWEGTPGSTSTTLRSIHIAIVCGRAPHEATGVGKLLLSAPQPSLVLFSPAALTYSHVLGGAVTAVVTDPGVLPAGVEREVTLVDLDGNPIVFRFPADSAVGTPTDTTAGTAFRLRKTDSNGAPTTGSSPAYYEFHIQGVGKFIRYSAATYEAVGYSNGSGRFIQAADTQVEVIRDTAGALRQIRNATDLANIVVPQDGTTENGTIWKYSIAFYPSADVGAKVDGLYTLNANAEAHTLITVENPAEDKDNDVDTLRLTRTVGTTDYTYEYTYTDASKQWQLSRGTGLPTQTQRSAFDDTGKIETLTGERRDGQDALVASVIRTRVSFDWGRKPVTRSERTDAGDDTALLTTRYRYYAPALGAQDPRAAYIVATQAAAKQGKLQSVREPDGSWTLYDYDSQGRTSLIVRPWKDQTVDWDNLSEQSAADAAEDGHATYYSYTGVDSNDSPAADDGRPRTVTEKVAGTTVAVTYHAHYTNTSGEVVRITERAATPSVAYGATGSLRTTTTHHAATAASAAAGRVKTVQHPDGRLDTHAYEAGTYTADPDPAQCTFSAGTGSAFRTTVTHGTATSPDGIAFHTTREATVSDGYGNEVLTETYAYDGTGYERVAWTVRTCDERWRPTAEYRSDGTSSSAVWGCCAKDSETLADGSEWAYVYDEFYRLAGKTKECGATDIVTAYTYDGAGRRIQEAVTAGTLSLTANTAYDLAGRVLEHTDPAGLSTATAYADGGRTVTVTRPGGGTEVTAQYLDGRLKSVTGTAVPDRYYDYGVDTTSGQRWTCVYSGAIPQGGTFTDIPLWEKTWADALGRTVKIEKPAFGHTPQAPAIATRESYYNSLGQLWKTGEPGRADTLYEYDAAGAMVRSGLDVDASGTLALAAADRITDTDALFEEDTGGAWWRRNVAKVYPNDADDPATQNLDERASAVTTAVRAVRLTGLGSAAPTPYSGVLTGESRTTDVHGSEMVSRTYVDAGTKTVWQITDSPLSTADAAVKTVNGLQAGATSASGNTTHRLYDALGRRVGITDPRASVYDQQAGTWSHVAEAHYNSAGQVDWTKDTAGNQTGYAYNSTSGLQTGVTNALGRTKITYYDAAGRVLAVWGDTEYPVRYEYDELGRVTSLRTLRSTAVTLTSYQDFLDNAASFDCTTWTYEACTGLLTAKRYADNEGPDYTYNEAGRLTSRVWARTANNQQITTTYSYASATGELAGVDYADSTPDVTYTYDRLGRRTSIADAAGTRSFAYSATSLELASETLPSAFYGNDAAIGRSVDTLGRDAGFAVSLAASTVSSVGYTYDSYGRFSQVAWSVNGGTQRTGIYTYAADSDLVASLALPGDISISKAFEAERNLIDVVENKVGTTTVSRYDYSNDASGRRTGRAQSGTAFTQSDTVSWSYNDRSEVTGGEAANDAAYDFGYAYDPIGNRLTSSVGATTTTYTGNALNQYTAISGLTGTPAYDDDGNMTAMPSTAGEWTLAWNAENQLAAVAKTTPGDGDPKLEFVYDYMGRRIRKTVSAFSAGQEAYLPVTDTRFVYDGWNLIGEFTVDAGDAQSARTYVWGLDLSQSLQGAGGIGGLVAVTEWSPAVGGGFQTADYYPTFDANGNVSEYIDSTGATVAHYEYSPFGELTAATGTKAAGFPHRFSTKYFDALAPSTTDQGLYYYGFRYYSPVLGRWVSTDPVDELGSLVLAEDRTRPTGVRNMDAQMIVFARNSPLSHADPLGLQITEKCYKDYQNCLWHAASNAAGCAKDLGLTGSAGGFMTCGTLCGLACAGIVTPPQWLSCAVCWTGCGLGFTIAEIILLNSCLNAYWADMDNCKPILDNCKCP